MERVRKHRIFKAILWLAGIWVTLLLAIQIFLSPSVLNKLIDRYAPEYIDGRLEFSRARVHMFRHFPNVGITLENGSLTYPAERFDSLKAIVPQGRLLYGGCSEEADTLASFRRFSTGINIGSLISGKVSIPHIELEKPRIFAHSYDSTHVNWNIFRTNGKDTTSAVLPPISIGRVILTDHPHIVYTSSKDTLFAMFDVKKIAFDGRLDTRKASRTRIGLTFDSLIVAGRIAADTLGMRMDRLHIHEHNDHMDIHADAGILIATRTFGRMHVPVSIKGTAAIDVEEPSIGLHGFKAEIASIPLDFDLDLRRTDGHAFIDGRFEASKCRIEDLIDGYLGNIIPTTAALRTDAVVSLSGSCSGFIGNGMMPSFNVSMLLPKASVSHKDLRHNVSLSMKAKAGTDNQGRINVSVEEAGLETYGMKVHAGLGISDLTGGDPLISIDGRIRASADSLLTFLPKDSGITANGSISAEMKGNIRLSQMDIYNFGEAEITGSASSDKLELSSPKDTISINLQGLSVNVAPEARTSTRNGNTVKLLGIAGELEKAEVSLKDAVSFNGLNISFSAKNSTDALSGKDTTRIHPLGGHLKAEELALKDSEGLSLTLDETKNRFQMVPKTGHPDIPVLSLSSTNKRIYLRDNINRVILTDAGLSGTAAMNSIERRQKRRAYMDSLAAVYPDIPRDSLMRHIRSQRQSKNAVPEWMAEEDFKSGDLNFSLDGIMAEYFRKWDIDGKINVRTGIIMTPYVPMRNILKSTEVTFSNDMIRINGFKILTGQSEIEAKGTLSGLRRALLGRGTYKLDMDITSEKMNADELLAALNTGAAYIPPEERNRMSEVSDSEFLQMVVNDTLVQDDAKALLIVPSDLNADIRLKAADIRFSGLDISSLTAEIAMKERCMQITGAKAVTNMGQAGFEGFYATRTKQDIRTGFNFSLTDVTSEKVIAMMPAIDTIMPLLKSFSGLIDCELAATASMDTCMNVLTPTINGVVRIEGENLVMKDNEVFTDLARKLKFKNIREGRIDRMTVEGVIKDNILEVFPFVLELDRYTLALSGLHKMDMSYRYHVSIIRSPIVFKVGVDIYGSDFSNMKFKIGKPKYRNTDVPVFTTVIDQTRINLAESIRGIFDKGVELAVKENERQEAINAHKERIGYINAAEQTIEELSAEEQKLLEDERTRLESPPVIDSLSISRTLNEYILKETR